MRPLRDAWTRFWFAPSDPMDLGVSRLVCLGLLAILYLPADWSLWAGVSRDFWIPTTFFRLFDIPVLPASSLLVLQTAWKAALCLAAIGLWTRPSLIVAAAVSPYLLGLPHNFGKTHHFDALVVLVLIVLAASRCGDAWSIDALRRRIRHPQAAAPRPPSPEYTWPIRAVWSLMAIVFFSSGLAKLRTSGLRWAFSDNLSILLQSSSYHMANADPLLPWGLALAQAPLLYQGLAAMTLFCEACYPLALVSVPMRWIVVPGMFGSQVGIRLFMGPTFTQFLICNAFWVPWRRVGERLRAWLGAGRRRITILYDGDCGLCQRTIAVVRQLDLLGAVEIRNALTEWPELSRRFPGLTQDACLADMHGVTASGRVVVGFDTYRALAWVLPLGWLLLPSLYLPGVRPIGRRVYRAIAARRFRAGCPVPQKS
jgi:predicted DCC family thiol-disulfide oxidoreductase YuxK